MKRKVVLHGPSTLGISLPSTWINEEGIKKGDEIDIAEEEDSLVIKTLKRKPLQSVIVDASRLGPLIKRSLVRMYQSGYDQITINFDNQEAIKKVREILFDELVGFEITEQTASSCTIKDLSGKSEEDPYTFFKRLFIIIDGMLSEGIEAIKKQEYSILKSIGEREIDVDRATNFCLRQLNKSNKNSIRDYLVIYHLELVGDCYYELINNLITDSQKKLDTSFFVLHKEINDFFSDIYDFALKPSIEGAVLIAREHDKLKIRIKQALIGSKAQTRTILIMNEMIKNMINIQNAYLGDLFADGRKEKI